jgi:hypothetical protein
MKKFQQNVSRELRRAYPDRRRLECQCLSAISFVKNEPDMLDSPIWVLIINVVAMDMLKSKLPPSKSAFLGTDFLPCSRGSLRMWRTRGTESLLVFRFRPEPRVASYALGLPIPPSPLRSHYSWPIVPRGCMRSKPERRSAAGSLAIFGKRWTQDVFDGFPSLRFRIGWFWGCERECERFLIDNWVPRVYTNTYTHTHAQSTDWITCQTDNCNDTRASEPWERHVRPRTVANNARRGLLISYAIGHRTAIWLAPGPRRPEFPSRWPNTIIVRPRSCAQCVRFGSLNPGAIRTTRIRTRSLSIARRLTARTARILRS